MKSRKKDSKRAKVPEGEKVGYARVSTAMQNLDMQIKLLKREGCVRIYTDQMSGSVVTREGWHDCWRYLREGDTLIVYSLSRIGRDMEHLLRVERELYQRGIKLLSLTDPFNTTSSAGRFLFNVLAASAQFQRETARDNTIDSINVRRAEGKQIGRPSRIDEKAKAKIKRDILATSKGVWKYTLKQIWEKYDMNKAMLNYHFPGGREGVLAAEAKKPDPEKKRSKK